MDDQSSQTIGSFPFATRSLTIRSMKLLTRIATRIDAFMTVVIGTVLRGAMAALTFVLRRGRHRQWRQDAEASRQRSDASRS